MTANEAASYLNVNIITLEIIANQRGLNAKALFHDIPFDINGSPISTFWFLNRDCGACD